MRLIARDQDFLYGIFGHAEDAGRACSYKCTTFRLATASELQKRTVSRWQSIDAVLLRG
jgi:hypothetical protein